MMRLMMTLVLGLAFVTMATFAVAQDKKAEEKKEGPKQWSGSVDDLKAMEGIGSAITDAKVWEKVVKDWKIEKAPEVDFKKQLVAVTTSRGSRLNLNVMVKDGDLKIGGFGTRDLRDGFRYVLQVVDREGIKTVEGKPLPESK